MAVTVGAAIYPNYLALGGDVLCELPDDFSTSISDVLSPALSSPPEGFDSTARQIPILAPALSSQPQGLLSKARLKSILVPPTRSSEIQDFYFHFRRTVLPSFFIGRTKLFPRHHRQAGLRRARSTE